MTLQEFLTKVDGRASDVINYSGDEAVRAVERNGYALRYVKDQTEDICVKAVERNGDALQYVKDQTEDICVKAVERNGYALQYVKDQTEDICVKAVENDGYALQYVNKLIFEVTATLKVSVADIEAKFGGSVEIISACNTDE